MKMPCLHEYLRSTATTRKLVFELWKEVSTCHIEVTYRVNILAVRHSFRTVRCIVRNISLYIQRTERGYGAKWQRERRKFLESNPFCVKCYEEGHITMATVVDHIVPHRGDQKLFWDRGNWQPLCEHHHNVKTMTEDRYVEYKF